MSLFCAWERKLNLGRGLAVLAGALALVLALTLTGCKEPDPTVVRFVVPDGFRGVFKVTPRPIPGAPKAPAIVPNTVNVVEVSPSGTVYMANTSGFIPAHKVECVTKSGTAIHVSTPAGVDKGINLFPIYSEASGEQFYLVGTRRERDFVWKEGRAHITLAVPLMPDDTTGD